MNEERARAAVEHLQAAAIELIEAARAVLDVAEELVRDPSELVAMAAAVGQAAERLADRDGGRARSGSPASRENARERDVERIPVS